MILQGGVCTTLVILWLKYCGNVVVSSKQFEGFLESFNHAIVLQLQRGYVEDVEKFSSRPSNFSIGFGRHIIGEVPLALCNLARLCGTNQPSEFRAILSGPSKGNHEIVDELVSALSGSGSYYLNMRVVGSDGTTGRHAVGVVVSSDKVAIFDPNRGLWRGQLGDKLENFLGLPPHRVYIGGDITGTDTNRTIWIYSIDIHQK